MNITIDKTIKQKTPSFSIGVLEANVQVKDSSTTLHLLKEIEETLKRQYTINDVIHIPSILHARNAYKAYGKDPSRYRLAVESLYRRVVKDNPLYQINNLVDLGNYLSILTAKSVAVLDKDYIEGDITIRLGTKEDHYEGIARGTINVENIPLYEDTQAPFGSTTSDTMRTRIRLDTTNMLLFIISFEGETVLQRDLENAINLYKEYADAKDIQVRIIK